MVKCSFCFLPKMLGKQGRVLLGVPQVVLCSSNYCIDLDPWSRRWLYCRALLSPLAVPKFVISLMYMYFEIIASIPSFLKALLFGLTEPSGSCLNHLILWEPRGLFWLSVFRFFSSSDLL